VRGIGAQEQIALQSDILKLRELPYGEEGVWEVKKKRTREGSTCYASEFNVSEGKASATNASKLHRALTQHKSVCVP
jgi:hypothetical protein